MTDMSAWGLQAKAEARDPFSCDSVPETGRWAREPP